MEEEGWAFMENAGGSQMPDVVVEAIRSYSYRNFVQLGAGYPASARATDTVNSAHKYLKTFMNATSVGEVILGNSTTTLMNMLADCYAQILDSSSQIIIHNACHEANIGCWVRLAERLGCKPVFWKVEPNDAAASSLEQLESLLTLETRIVAVTHVSNILGEILPLEEVCKLVHRLAPKARVVADGVAFAPHRAIDVTAWGVDYYVYSAYKVYSSHQIAVLFGRNEALSEVEGPNHFFIDRDSIPYKFEAGGCLHEGLAGFMALPQYFARLVKAAHGDAEDVELLSRRTVELAFGVMTRMEIPLQKQLLDFLCSRDDVRVIGSHATDAETRVGTISFVHRSVTSDEIIQRLHAAGIACRNGHMYAIRLLTSIPDIQTEAPPGSGLASGVVRISMLHYNTLSEVDKVIETLREVFDKNEPSPKRSRQA